MIKIPLHRGRQMISGSAQIRITAAGTLVFTGHAPTVLVAGLVEEPVSNFGLILHSSKLLVLGDKSSRGERVIDTTPLFWKLLLFAKENGPEALHRELPKDGRLFEELIAGIYKQTGYEMVELSPQSGDGGVDV